MASLEPNTFKQHSDAQGSRWAWRGSLALPHDTAPRGLHCGVWWRGRSPVEAHSQVLWLMLAVSWGTACVPEWPGLPLGMAASGTR